MKFLTVLEGIEHNIYEQHLCLLNWDKTLYACRHLYDYQKQELHSNLICDLRWREESLPGTYQVYASGNYLPLPDSQTRKTRNPTHVWKLWPASACSHSITCNGLSSMRQTPFRYRHAAYLRSVCPLCPDPPEHLRSPMERYPNSTHNDSTPTNTRFP